MPHPSFSGKRGTGTVLNPVLDRVREAIGAQRRAADGARDLRRTAIRTLFASGLRGEAQRETELGPIPETWEVEAHGNLFEIEQGLSPAAIPAGGDYEAALLRTSNVHWGEIDLEAVSRIPVARGTLREKMLGKGDLVVCGRGEVGRTAIWSGEIDHCLYHDDLHRLRPRANSQVLPRFAMAWLEEVFRHRRVYGAAKSTEATPTLSSAQLAELLVPRPPHREQADIIAVIDAMDHKIDLHRRRRAVLEELLEALAHEPITGDREGGIGPGSGDD